MNKQQLIAKVTAFSTATGVDMEDIIIAAGGASLLFGFREDTDDIDIDLPDYIFQIFLDSGLFTLSYFGDTDVEVLSYDGDIDLHRRTKHIDTVQVDGVHCYSHAELLALRLHLNRPKDQEDIKHLREYLKV